MNLLNSISFGQHYIEIALLLRESMFLSGILNNVEVWYGMTKSEVEEFDNLDLSLLRKILQAPISTPKEAFYLELGLLPLGVQLKVKRINYLKYLLTRKQDEMISKFFWTQWRNPTRGDWTESVKQDLKDFKIELEEIIGKSKLGVKTMVKTKAKEFALLELLHKKQKHSKLDRLQYNLLKLQDYYKLPGVNISELRDAFKFRVRMAEFGQNFRGNEEFVGCPLCSSHLDNQNMLFQCLSLKTMLSSNLLHINIEKIYTDNIDTETIKIIKN